MNANTSNSKCAIITGAGEGIGKEIAIQFARSGIQIVLNDINPKSAENVVELIKGKGGDAIAIVGNASEVSVIKELVASAVRRFGQVNYVIANAGITTFGSFLEYHPDQFNQLIKVNLFGSFFLAQEGAKQFVTQGTEGRIIFMSSVTGHQAHPKLAAYGMTKAALEMLAKQLSIELSVHSIKVNAIAPGATLTPRTDTSSEDYKETWERITPLGRICTPEDIAQCALFLISEGARQITGQTIIIDGGWTSVSPPPN